MATRRRQVTLEDLQTRAFIDAVKSGNVYMIIDESDTDKQLRAKAVLDYVGRISDMAREMEPPIINKVWEALLQDEVFSKEFEVKHKGKIPTLFNKYTVMKIVGVMFEAEIYACQTKTELHDRLEQTHKRTSYFPQLSIGLEMPLIKRLMTVINKVKNEENEKK